MINIWTIFIEIPSLSKKISRHTKEIDRQTDRRTDHPKT